MIIGGLQKFSLLDFPGRLAAIIFTQGCNFRCQFCYNPMLVWPIEADKLQNRSSEEDQKGYPQINEDSLFAFLRSRAGKLDGVVVTGGEPTIHSDLPDFIRSIREIGYQIKLDTNGSNPAMLKELLAAKLLDHIAMDIKTAPAKYDIVTGVQPELEKLTASIGIILQSGLPYEFRSTLVPGLIGPEDIPGIGDLIKGAEIWYLQKFKNDTPLLNSSFSKIGANSNKEMEKMRKIGEKFVKSCLIR